MEQLKLYKGTTTTKALIGCLVGCLALTINYHEHRALAAETRASPQQVTSAQNNSTSARLQKQPQFEGTCGNSDDLAKRVEVCAKPLMGILQGTIEKWPRTEDDARILCESFTQSDRCIRETSRRCGKGIQKTIISTLALSIGRARKRECSKAKYQGIVKVTTCIEKHQDMIHDWMGNVTARLSAIETQTRDGDKKINGVCCMVQDIEREVKKILDPLCPTESQFVVRLYRTVLEDVIELVCRNPKCNDYIKGYKVNKSADFSGIISILLRTVFSLDNS